MPFKGKINIPAKAKSIKIQCWIVADFGSNVNPRVTKKEATKYTKVWGFLWDKSVIDFGNIDLSM